MDLMAASLPAGLANSRFARRATAPRRARGATLTWQDRQARIYREIEGGESSDDAPLTAVEQDSPVG